MTCAVDVPGVAGLAGAVDALCEWQHDGAPVQLHPGDLGWFWRAGTEATAAAVRIWSRQREILAVGLLDGPTLLRLAIAPMSARDPGLAAQVASDLAEPERGVLPQGRVTVEARGGALLFAYLRGRGWKHDDPWTPLRRTLTGPIPDGALRIEVIGAPQAAEWVGVHRASFDGSTSTEDRWQAMAAGVPFADAQCLVGYDDHGTAVAAATLWSAGPGRPGLLEPVGVHRDHRGHGYGTAISLAAAAALHSLGSSEATVCTPSSNVAAVATYESAGFTRLPEARDLYREA